MAVYKIDPKSGERLGLLATARVGDGGWVDLPEPIIVRAGTALMTSQTATARSKNIGTPIKSLFSRSTPLPGAASNH